MLPKNSTKKVIVLSGDYGYINQITTTIKSVLYHNRGSKFYLINSDVPQEWFKLINHQLRHLDSVIIDKKVRQSMIDQEYVRFDHIKPIAYGKIMIPDLIDDNGRVLYLDSDLVVDDDLTPLFDLDLRGYPLAAALDINENNGHFNTGVVLLDMAKLRQIPHLVADELKLGQNQALRNADQDVMNQYFQDNFYELPLADNYQIGMDMISFYGNYSNYFTAMDKVAAPRIIHYLTSDKPWKTISTSRLRDRWWQYFGLSWDDIDNHRPLPQLDSPYHGRCCTFLTSENMGQLPKLVRMLPDYQFNIAAWSNFGEPVMQLLAAENVRLYPCITQPQIDELVRSCDAYLDVNLDGKEDQILRQFEEAGTPLASFQSVAAEPGRYQRYQVFADNDVADMVRWLQELAK